MYNSKKIILTANRLAARNFTLNKNEKPKKMLDTIAIEKFASKNLLHTTISRTNLASTAILPLPHNIDAAETTRFSPQRARDINADVIYTQTIDITADNTTTLIAGDVNTCGAVVNDPHVQSYDCFGAVSLNSVMQSNVPEPYGGMNKFSHLNMPGGQWSQEGKFTSQDLHSSHYTALRNDTRANWLTYDQNATIAKTNAHIYATATNQQQQQQQQQRLIATSTALLQQLQKRKFSTKLSKKEETLNEVNTNAQENVAKDDIDRKTTTKIDSTTNTIASNTAPLTKKEQLKKAFKEYGTTVIVFHVAISLVSLGAFYTLVASGIDMMPLLEYLGLASTTLANKLAAGASTFVVAYAIHKVFAPVRISITLASTPLIVRYLRSKGILKKPITQK